MKKKRYLSYFLAMAFVLVASVLLSQPAEALLFGSVTPAVSPLAAGTVVVTELFPPNGQQVAVQAFPAPNYEFSHWTDSLNSIPNTLVNPTDFTVIGAHTVTAHFTEIPPPPTCYLLTATASPLLGGSVTAPPRDTSCEQQGQYYLEGASISLTASANNGYQFHQWTGDLPLTIDSDQSSIEITMDQSRSVTAHFVEVCQPLTLSTNGLGADLAASPKNSSGCETDSYTYKAGQAVALTANPAAGWKVTSWDIGATNVASESNTYPLVMPPLPFGQGLLVQVNYEEKATFGFASALPQGVAENAGTVQIEVIRDPSTVADAGTIQYTTFELNNEATEGDDYLAKSGSLSFAQGQNSKIITITIKNDIFNEGQESFEVRLSESDPNIKLGVSTIEVQIDDDEGDPTIRFEQSTYTADESSTSVTVAVTVFPLPESGDVYVDLDTQNGTATAGKDYSAISERPLRIRTSRDETRATTTISLTPDDLDELDEETVLLQLINPSNNAVIAADSEAVLKILDDDLPPSVGFSESEYFEKVPGHTEALIPVNLSTPSGQGVKVDYKVTHETSGDIKEEKTLTITAGALTKSLAVPIASANPGDVFTLQLSNPQNVELGPLNAARLTVLSTDETDCHDLIFAFDGYGQAPAATSKQRSTGCDSGQYVAGELIDIVAQPERGWYVDSWTGTIDDENSSMQNAVEMPNTAFTVHAAYRVPIFFSVINYEQPSFAGPYEAEPNSLFSDANGPLVFDRDYRGNFSDTTDAHDFFYFQLDLETSVTITLDDIANGKDYDLALYDEDFTNGYIVASQNYENDPETITKTLQPGKYFVQVFARPGEPTTDPYRLNVKTN